MPFPQPTGYCESNMSKIVLAPLTRPKSKAKPMTSHKTTNVKRRVVEAKEDEMSAGF